MHGAEDDEDGARVAVRGCEAANGDRTDLGKVEEGVRKGRTGVEWSEMTADGGGKGREAHRVNGMESQCRPTANEGRPRFSQMHSTERQRR